MPEKLRGDFLMKNKKFSEKDLTKNPFAQWGLPFDTDILGSFDESDP